MDQFNRQADLDRIRMIEQRRQIKAKIDIAKQVLADSIEFAVRIVRRKEVLTRDFSEKTMMSSLRRTLNRRMQRAKETYTEALFKHQKNFNELTNVYKLLRQYPEKLYDIEKLFLYWVFEFGVDIGVDISVDIRLVAFYVDLKDFEARHKEDWEKHDNIKRNSKTISGIYEFIIGNYSN